MSRRGRKSRREQLRKDAQARPEATAPRANAGETSAAWKPPSSLTPKRLRFAVLWAEADPEDSLQDIARAAGYSESVSSNGYVAELCRDPAVIAVRDHRLAELQQASSVTVEDTLIGLRAIGFDPLVGARDRVAALKTILAWYSKDKGQQGQSKVKGDRAGLGQMLAEALEEHLGIPLEETKA